MTATETSFVPRPEHPRPDFMRDTYFNLNGEWQFSFDDENIGLAKGWQQPDKNFEQQITVPFCYQSGLSGIGPTDEIHPVLWYRRSFTVPQTMQGQRVLLRFGAVDYRCSVYVNGALAGGHVGGYTPFALDITRFLCPGENDLCLRVQDDPDCTQPRGKQYWNRGLFECWYTPVSGIWQTVYLEAVGAYAITQIHVTPDIDKHMFTAEIALDRAPDSPLTLELAVSFEGTVIRTLSVSAPGRITSVPVDMSNQVRLGYVRFWSPWDPALYDLSVRVLADGRAEDHVTTYFGMRKVEVRDGRVYLNNFSLYQRLILDQGYWPDSLLTPPSDEAIRTDIRLTKELGYNGARKHQKLEDPRYYYWADCMGLLVWEEIPSVYMFTDESVRNLADTLMYAIDRDFNHPSVIAWVPLNESWGVQQIYTDPRQQATGRMLYHMTKALDGTRLCSANDGWEQTTTDICALHDYTADESTMKAHFASRDEVEKHGCDVHFCYAQSETPTGKEAFFVTEYGGIAFANQGEQGEMNGLETWGYHDKVTSEDAFFARFKGQTSVIRRLAYGCGYCYTQLTDVMQEINGLLTPDRKPKMDVERIRRLNCDPGKASDDTE
ncbi:MAG TPA: glycoside hydrolase family 2 TIM barrel-domain containing protein [Candidatus Limiplasma sp.]|nr:glycoside hydrolase family 2 TIM barrel-domain containing protein [Candidatus Limiplasma sp.]